MYSLLIHVVYFFIRIAALWNEKLKQFVQGRKNLFPQLEKALSGQENIIWFHSASYGEFEEARPILDLVKEQHPEYKILLTFFSPSGYLARKNYKNADWVFYLPMDTYSNAKKFVNIVKPKKAIFTIGEYWFNYLDQLSKHEIDTYIMSVRILPDSPYLKWYGAPFRKLFKTKYKKIIVKDKRSVELLNGIGVKVASYLGDARFDRVLDIATEPWSDSIVDTWCEKPNKVFVAGSTCPGGDDDLVIALANAHPKDKFMIIPHEIHEDALRHIEENVNNSVVRYSAYENMTDSKSISESTNEKKLKEAQILIVDKVGMLSRLYRYADISFIGGGFINMPHSVIEAAVYGMPVLIGPQYKRDIHFVQMKEAGFGFSVATEQEIIKLYDRLHSDNELLESLSSQAEEFCQRNKGASRKILSAIFD